MGDWRRIEGGAHTLMRKQYLDTKVGWGSARDMFIKEYIESVSFWESWGISQLWCLSGKTGLLWVGTYICGPFRAIHWSVW